MKKDKGAGSYKQGRFASESDGKTGARSAATTKGKKKGAEGGRQTRPLTEVPGDLWPVVERPRYQDEVPKSDRFFYMPVDQLRAQVFLAHGLIYPSAYDKAGAATGFDDIQRMASADLLLFDNPQPIKKNQLLLKVVLSDEEVADCKIISGVIKFPMPLPVSRLVAIGVSSAIENLDTYVLGWIKPDVPVPTHLFYSLDDSLLLKDQEIYYEMHPYEEPPIHEINDNINNFNRYLGVLAYIRNAHRYFTQSSLYYSDYPDLYFSLTSELLNEKTASSEKKSAILSALLDLGAETNVVQKEIMSLVKSKIPFIEKDIARKIAADIFGEDRSNDELRQGFSDLFIGDYRAAIQRLQQQNMPPEAAILAVLYKYSNRQSNDYLNLKQRLHEDWSLSARLVEALGVLGAYYGYTSLPANETRLYSVHPQFAPLINDRPPIKFNLDSRWECLVIEAAYQRAFYNQFPSEKIKALYTPARSARESESPTSFPKWLIDRSFRVHDVKVKRYEISEEGRIFIRLLTIKSDFIDETTELGRYLFHPCFQYAEEREHSWKGIREIMRYRISKQAVVDLISQGKVVVNSRIIKAILDEDSRSHGK